jgi:hypothetical protein
LVNVHYVRKYRDARWQDPAMFDPKHEASKPDTPPTHL